MRYLILLLIIYCFILHEIRLTSVVEEVNTLKTKNISFKTELGELKKREQYVDSLHYKYCGFVLKPGVKAIIE